MAGVKQEFAVPPRVVGDRAMVHVRLAERLGAAAFIENDRILVPLRFVAAMLGERVSWDGATQTVDLTDNPACRSGDPLKGVYSPDRLRVLAPCVTVTGIIGPAVSWSSR